MDRNGLVVEQNTILDKMLGLSQSPNLHAVESFGHGHLQKEDPMKEYFEEHDLGITRKDLQKIDAHNILSDRTSGLD